MNLNELSERLELSVLNKGSRFGCQVTRGYVSDLLSDVLAHADEGAVWITLQTHRNVIAVAVLRKVGAVLLTGSAAPDSQTLDLARREGVSVLSTRMSAFEAAGRVYALLAAEDGNTL